MAILKEVSSFEDYKVQIVTAFPDLYVYVTDNKMEAAKNDAVWYFEDAFPKRKIKFVRAFPDLKIQYVNSRSAAGWRNKTHKLQKRLG